MRVEPRRLAGPTLLWRRGELLLRLEGRLPPRELPRVAKSAG